MIDNQLKKCCEKCNFDDLFTKKVEIEPSYCMDREKDEFYQVSSRTIIGCKHMYVCKKYIENQEAEG